MQAVLRVTCAIIVKKNKILCAQRGQNMSHSLLWEFPGGKIEKSETDEACIIREINEELNLKIFIKEKLKSYFHLYPPNKKIELIPFICGYIGGKLKFKEHNKILWLSVSELESLSWVEADIQIVNYLKENFDPNKN